jgi:hypothetical protein
LANICRGPFISTKNNTLLSIEFDNLLDFVLTKNFATIALICSYRDDNFINRCVDSDGNTIMQYIFLDAKVDDNFDIDGLKSFLDYCPGIDIHHTNNNGKTLRDIITNVLHNISCLKNKKDTDGYKSYENYMEKALDYIDEYIEKHHR